MKTSQGKLATLAFLLLLVAAFLVPMRAGQEDRLILEPEELRLDVGESYTLRCALSAENANQGLRFESSDAKVAEIEADGTVRALAPGETVIRALTSGGARAEVHVTVEGIPLRTLQLNVDELHIAKGEYSGLRASFNMDASDTRIAWVSSDESVVRVNSSGRLEGVGGGMAYVSAVSPSGMRATARVYVEVEGVAVHISPGQLTLGVGAQVPLRVAYLPLDCTDRVQRWISSNVSVLSVNDGGVLEARSPGSAYVTVVTEGGLTDGMSVTVEDAPLGLRIDPAGAALERGDALQLQLMFLEEGGGVQENLTHLTRWTSSDESIARVDSAGLVTALKSGSCVIEAAADGMTAACALSVAVNVREITLDQSEVYLLREDADEPIQLHWEIAPADADNPALNFESDNEQVAKVSPEGLVELTGGYGTAVITATAASGAQAEFTVNVVTQLPEAEPDASSEPTERPENAAPYEEMYEEAYGEDLPAVAETPLPAAIG